MMKNGVNDDEEEVLQTYQDMTASTATDSDENLKKYKWRKKFTFARRIYIILTLL